MRLSTTCYQRAIELDRNYGDQTETSPADRDAARVRALAAYKDVWKDADPDIPILKQAKAEYATLQ